MLFHPTQKVLLKSKLDTLFSDTCSHSIYLPNSSASTGWEKFGLIASITSKENVVYPVSQSPLSFSQLECWFFFSFFFLQTLSQHISKKDKVDILPNTLIALSASCILLKNQIQSPRTVSPIYVSSRINKQSRKLIFLLWFSMIYWPTYKNIILKKLYLNP